MTLTAYFGSKQRCRRVCWLRPKTYPQNIPRTTWPRLSGHLLAFGVNEGTRRPVSRVLCRPDQKIRTRRSFLWTVPRGTVLATYPDRWTNDGPAGSLRRTVPIRSCSWRGLPCRPCCQRRGALLPHPFTLPAPEGGGLLSVALSLGSPPAGVTRRHVVVEPGLSSNVLQRPRPPGHLVRAEPDRLGAQGQPVPFSARQSSLPMAMSASTAPSGRRTRPSKRPSTRKPRLS